MNRINSKLKVTEGRTSKPEDRLIKFTHSAKKKKKKTERKENK